MGLYVHGSWVLGDFAPDRSDLDLLAVLDRDPTDGTLAELGPVHRPMLRISPGEPLHLVGATRHRLLDWYVARERGLPLLGPHPTALIAEITAEQFGEVVLEHAATWPVWVQDMRTPGSQAYAVLTVCRVLHWAAGGGQVSKRRAAATAVQMLPRWAHLVRWAETWWYGHGSDLADDRSVEVVAFVGDVSQRVAAVATGARPPPLGASVPARTGWSPRPPG